jgi:hypothetical protein
VLLGDYTLALKMLDDIDLRTMVTVSPSSTPIHLLLKPVGLAGRPQHALPLSAFGPRDRVLLCRLLIPSTAPLCGCYRVSHAGYQSLWEIQALDGGSGPSCKAGRPNGCSSRRRPRLAAVSASRRLDQAKRAGQVRGAAPANAPGRVSFFVLRLFRFRN